MARPDSRHKRVYNYVYVLQQKLRLNRKLQFVQYSKTISTWLKNLTLVSNYIHYDLNDTIPTRIRP